MKNPSNYASVQSTSKLPHVGRVSERSTLGPHSPLVDKSCLVLSPKLAPNTRLAIFFFFFFFAKSFIVSIWFIARERAPGWLKSCLVAAKSGLGTSHGTKGMSEGPLKSCGALEAPSGA